MFKIKTASIVIGALFLASSALKGSVGSGGNFTIESSLTEAGGSLEAAGGNFSLTGAAGQGFYPLTVAHFPLRGYPYRLYEGYFGVPLLIEPSVSETIQIPLSNNWITIPADRLPLPYDPMIETDPVQFPINGDPAGRANGVQKLKTVYGDFVAAPVTAVELGFLLSDDSLFTEPIPVSVSFSLPPPSDNPPTNEAVRRTTARQYNPMTEEWEVQRVNFATSGLGISLTGLFPGALAVFETGSLIAGGAKAYPVPWRPNAGRPSLYGTAGGGITFADLPSIGIIKIFNLSGEVVREIKIPPGLASGVLVWDGKTGTGQDVASGVYLWIVQSGEDSKTGKLMIIR